MTRKQRDALLKLPETEAEILRHHMLDADDLAAVNQCRTPETRLSYALQLCCLRFPGRYLSRGELLPGIMLDHIADQVQADADVITLFARRGATRYEQLTAIKQRHGFRDLSRPLRDELAAWAQDEAVGVTDGRVLLDRLIGRMRAGRIIIPGISVVERLAATAMHSADLAAIAEIGALLSLPQCDQMDVLLSAKVHRQQSRLSWLRAPAGGVGARSLAEILDRLDLVRSIVGDVPERLPFHLNHRMAQMAREGSLYTAQAFQQMNGPRRYAVMMATLTDAIHAEPLSVWFGEGWRASADGQAFYLGGPGEAGGAINGHYGRDPIIKIYTTITDRYAPLHQKVIAGTAGEAIHALDGILGHESTIDIGALHVDGGGVSDIVFAIAALLGRSFEPRIPRLSERKLYAFEPKSRYGRLAPLFGHRLDANLILGHADEIGKVIRALADKVVTPSLILKKLSSYRQQNSLAAALREIGRIERTLFTLRWFEDPALRQLVTAELNKGEARNTLARAVAFHRLGRFRDRSHENQASRAAALNLVTAAIVLFNCRYLARITETMRRQGRPFDEKIIAKLSPLGWDHINITGDYVWSDVLGVDREGFLPIRSAPP